jgi:hypothetical protein
MLLQDFYVYYWFFFFEETGGAKGPAEIYFEKKTVYKQRLQIKEERLSLS